MSHTPGPWAVREAEGDELYEVYREAGGELITYAAATTKQRVNANLIAAAPDLLAVARMAFDYAQDTKARFIEHFDFDDQESYDNLCEACEKAIAKAEGGE